MGDLDSTPATALEVASAAVELRLQRLEVIGSVAALTGNALCKYGQGLAALGWQIAVLEDYTGTRRHVTLVLPEAFPVSPPFVVVEPSAYLQWPHCERDGKLCLWVSGRAPVGMRPESIVEHVFERIGRALQYSMPGADPKERQQEFELEWLSYWPAANADRIQTSMTVLMLDIPEREAPLLAKLVVRPGLRQKSGPRAPRPWFPLTLISSDKELLRQWSVHFVPFDDAKPQPVALYSPIRPPLPIGMPPSVDALRELLGVEARQLLESALRDAEPDRRPVWLILGAEFESGTALAGVELTPRIQSSPPRGGKYRSKTEVRNMMSNAPVVWVPRSVNVMRADQSWMLDRNVNDLRARLRASRVLLIGCGSLGSLVGEALTRAGVGHLTIVDAESFDAANVGRHVLGATSIGQYKAEAMADYLTNMMPQIEVIPVLREIQDARSDPIDFSQFDLVVCTTADWPSELHLISQRLTGKAETPLLLGWVEPHGVAGHGILSTSTTDALSTLFKETGEFRFSLSDWPDSGVHRTLPACQATFQPAALLNIHPVATMIAGLATDYLFGLVDLSQMHSWWTEASKVTMHGGMPSATAKEIPKNSMQQRELSTVLLHGSQC